MQILQIGNPKESEGVSELPEEAGRDWKMDCDSSHCDHCHCRNQRGWDDKDKNPQKISQTPSDDKQTSSENKKTDDTETQDKSNVFQVGDVVETEDFKITFVSAGKYKSDNEYITPKKGYEYWQFKFKFENTSDTDQNVSTMMDWECYADNSKADQQWIGDDSGLDATLSAGRQTEGTVYFEVPKDSKHIELEYDINYWQDNKIVFVGK